MDGCSSIGGFIFNCVVVFNCVVNSFNQVIRLQCFLRRAVIRFVYNITKPCSLECALIYNLSCSMSACIPPFAILLISRSGAEVVHFDVELRRKLPKIPMNNLARMFASQGMNSGGPSSTDGPVVDNSETVYISSLALLKMLKHGRAGVPMEVMGLMLGEFIDDYTISVRDVFAMPQSGTGVSVEAVDPVFQTKMMGMLTQTGRPESVVGWYHSHPGFGCWLSSVDINTQQSFEQMTPRCVAVVVDPVQSVKGKVVIDAFRLINPGSIMMGQEPRQTTSNIGHLNKPSIQALLHGLNRHYYSIAINYRKTPLEEQMLLNLHKTVWTSGLMLKDFGERDHLNQSRVESMVKLSDAYTKRVKEEGEMSAEQLKTRYVGKQDPKKHLAETADKTMEDTISQLLAAMIDRSFA